MCEIQCDGKYWSNTQILDSSIKGWALQQRCSHVQCREWDHDSFWSPVYDGNITGAEITKDFQDTYSGTELVFQILHDSKTPDSPTKEMRSSVINLSKNKIEFVDSNGLLLTILGSGFYCQEIVNFYDLNQLLLLPNENATKLLFVG